MTIRSTLVLFRRVSLLILLSIQAHGAELVSIAPRQPARGGSSSEPSISGDGRFVVFSSSARLLSEDQNSVSDVYLKDRNDGSLRLISDDRGGDQPIISADGQTIVYRTVEAFPKLRLVDLRLGAPPRTVSYPFAGGRSFRFADGASLSPNGQYVGFPFRPVPGFSVANPEVCTNDTLNPDRFNGAGSALTNSFILSHLGKAVVARDGNNFFFETKDGLLGADTNGRQDIYHAFRDDQFVVRLSASESGIDDEGEVRDPVPTAAANAVFFISERQLRAADEDGRATIYRSTIVPIATLKGTSAPPPLPEPIETSVTPISLSRQATGRGDYLTFLGKPKVGSVRPYLLRVSDGKLWALAGSGIESGPPVLSADNRFIAFASSAILSTKDRDFSSDVFVVPNPDPAAAVAAPTVTISGVSDGQEITQGTNVTINTSVTTPGSTAFSMSLEVDGIAVARVSSATLQRTLALPVGVHRIQARALNLANVPGETVALTLTVRAPANSLRVSPVSSTEALLREGATDFRGSLRVENTFGVVRGPLQVVLTETPMPVRWEIFGVQELVPPGTESLLQVIDLPAPAANSNSTVDFATIVSPPEPFVEGFQGRAFVVTARLREFVGGNWVDRDLVTLLTVLPRLNEDTPGPNGGIPVAASGINATTFNPAILQSIQIVGPGKVVGTGKARFSALATFNTGTKACNPQWQIIGGAGAASISPSGLLTAANVPLARNITVKASFGGRTQTLAVKINPKSPKVSIRASDALANEGGDPGTFKVSCSPATAADLAVSYEVGGKAIPNDDYLALPGTVVIPAGSSSATITVNPMQNGNFFEGREFVDLTLSPSSDYRLSSTKSASVAIEDDDTLPPSQPDATIKTSKGKPVGAFQIDDSFSVQEVRVRGIKNKSSTFFFDVVNRNSTTQDYTITGASDFLGFTVRYFFGSTEVTDEVVAGTFRMEGIEPEESGRLKVSIKPTKDTPLHGVIRCSIQAAGTFGNVDVVQATVERAK